MALDQSALLEVLDALKAADVGDRVRTAAETIYRALIEAELTDTIGAALHERSDTRTNLRNGHRTRTLTTTAGDLELRIPKLRTGSFFPSLLERRRRVDQALFAVVMEAYLHGVSTRKVDDLVKALGADTGISKSEVSRICADLDTEIERRSVGAAARAGNDLEGLGQLNWRGPTSANRRSSRADKPAIATRTATARRDAEHRPARQTAFCLLRWRKRRDSNPRTLSGLSLSRRVHSAALPRFRRAA
ncbi:MAG: putative transposase [Pseudonocardiales bacterium]|nr:putative transposase [Pseudonocardiales bacterium]